MLKNLLQGFFSGKGIDDIELPGDTRREPLPLPGTRLYLSWGELDGKIEFGNVTENELAQERIDARKDWNARFDNG